jgi:predicted glycosyltransferase
MRYLFFTNTPAHVHLYRHVVDELRARGHDVLVLGRDYGCTTALLDYYGLPAELYGSCGTSKGSLLRRLPGHYARIIRRARAFDPDLVFGTGGYAAPVGGLLRVPTVLVLDSEPTSLDHALSRPFASAILTPRAFRKDLGENHYTFAGFNEIAYLHPDVFEADPGVREELGLGPEEPFVILRCNAFGSHHDVGHGGLSDDQRRSLVKTLAEHATVLVSDEGDTLDVDALPAREFDLHPARMHDALAAASLLVTDTQTMATEAALLATPTIRSNSFVGDDDMGNFRALETAGLVENLAEFDRVSERAVALLTDPDAAGTWRQRRDQYVSDMDNLTAVLCRVALAGGRIEQVPELADWQMPRADATPSLHLP